MVKTDWAFVEPYQNKALIWVWDWGDDCFSSYWWNIKFSHCGSAEDLSSSSVDFRVEKAKLCRKAKLVLVRGMKINLKCLRVKLFSHFLLKIDHPIQDQFYLSSNTKCQISDRSCRIPFFQLHDHPLSNSARFIHRNYSAGAFFVKTKDFDDWVEMGLLFDAVCGEGRLSKSIFMAFFIF